MPDRPTPGQLEQRAQPLAVDGRRIRGVIPFGVESRQMPGGWTEVIEPRALDDADLSDLTLTVEHAGIPLARYPGTMNLEARADGLHWDAAPPLSRQDVVEAVSRGDLRSASFRMKVARDEWRGDTRHVHQISELRDVSLTSSPAYPDARIELRHTTKEEGPVPEVETVAPVTTPVASPAAPEEVRSVPVPADEAPRPLSGLLRVQDRSGGEPARGLADEFRHRGFPGELATMSWDEYESRAVTWSASVDVMNQVRRQGVPLGQDVRYAWPAFGRIGVGPEVTSVAVVSQTARALATPANVVRALDAVTAKPETASTLDLVTVALKQVATIQSGIPNVYLQQAAINTIIENDLALAINEGLDKLVVDALAGAGFLAPGTDVLVASIRKAITVLRAAGYSPDTLLLTPAADEVLDLIVTGIAGGVADYIWSPGQPAGSIFGLSRRVSKTIAAPVVCDSQALGKLYASPVSLAKFENASGTTNTANIRLELNAVFGTERIAAAVRLAAS